MILFDKNMASQKKVCTIIYLVQTFLFYVLLFITKLLRICRKQPVPQVFSCKHQRPLKHA